MSSNKRSILGPTAAVLFTLTLAACGGGDGASSIAAGGSSVTNQGQQPGSADSFFNRVMTLIADASETAEPQEIGSISVTTPENSEPVPLS